MSKLSFRARALDASRPMAVYIGEELPDLPDHSAISRAVPAMPTGMEKDEECEHHLQRAICAGLIIPTPEVSDMSDIAAYDRIYPPDYTKPRQLIHMQPLGLEQEVPDYDMDSEDERWLRRQHAAAGGRATDLTELKFEETMEKLERGSGQTVVTLREARALAGRTGPADHVLAAVYDYWLNKRLATQQPLLLTVRTEPRPGAPPASPYLAFRRRTEKMQTRKNRKNDESSYEKMVKLRRELSQVVSLLDLVRQREKLKRENVRLTVAVSEKRFAARDFGGSMIAEAKAVKLSVAPTLIVPSYGSHHRSSLDMAARQRDKRQYKRRKHRHHPLVQTHAFHHGGLSGSSSSSETEGPEGAIPSIESLGPFAFRRKPGCQYHMPVSLDHSDDVPWMLESHKENTNPSQDPRMRFSLASVNGPEPRCVGFVRRRMGRGGRVILDRLGVSPEDDRLWESLGYTVTDSHVPASPDATASTCHANQFSHSSSSVAADAPTDSVNKSGTSRLFNYLDPSSKFNVTTNSYETSDVTVKTEYRDAEEFSDSEKRAGGGRAGDVAAAVDASSDSDSLSSCDEHNYYNSKFSFKNGRAFKRYRDRMVKMCDARRTAAAMYRQDMKVMAELFVARSLARHERRVPDVNSATVDSFIRDVWGDRLHFKPKRPDENAPSARTTHHEPEAEQLTENSPITVHVRTALPDLQSPPSESLFDDTSPFVTSEFTLADIYGDAVISPDPDCDVQTSPAKTSSAFRDTAWHQTNGPSCHDRSNSASLLHEEGSASADVDDPPSPGKSNAFKGEPSDNSSSNQTSVFLSSEGGPPSAASVNSDSIAFSTAEDSNHEATNGVTSEWNDSNESDKIKTLLRKAAGNGLASKTRSAGETNNVPGSSVVRAETFPNQRIYLDCDRPASPSFSSLSAPPLKPTDRVEQKNQTFPIVQIKSPSILPPSKVKHVLKSVLAADVAEGRTPLIVTQGGSPVRKAPDGVRLRGADEVGTAGAGQQQQLVALSVPDSFKLRLQSHILSGGNAGGAGTASAHELLNLVHHKNLTPAATVSRDGISTARRTVVQVGSGNARPVRLLHAGTLSATQRSKLMAPGGQLQLRGIANLLQLQVRTPPRRTEPLEAAPQPVEAASAGTTSSGTGGEAGPASSGPAPAAGPPVTSGKPPPPPPSPRKGQASLPMEVT